MKELTARAVPSPSMQEQEQEQETVQLTSCGLLKLPREVRDTILRHLLLYPTSIYFTPRERGLYPQILRVNRQLCAEGLDVLYGENYFRMRIWENNQELAYFVQCDHFAKEVKYSLPRYTLIQHYDIYVEIQGEKDRWAVRSAVWKVAKVLSKVSTIEHLRITLGGHEEDYGSARLGEEVYACSRVLQPFTLLRGVRRVDFDGGLMPDYAKYLKDIMEGSPLLHPLPKMYGALERLVGHFDEFKDHLRTAFGPTCDDDIDTFGRIRAELTEKFVERTTDALNLLYHGTGQQEWVIEPRRSKKKRKKRALGEDEESGIRVDNKRRRGKSGHT